MSRFPRAATTATAAVALLMGAAIPTQAQDGSGVAEVRELNLPVSELVLETSSLDRSYRRAEGTEDVRVTLAIDVLFGFGSAKLGPRARSALREVAGEIRDLDGGTVTIEGHTDSKGSDAYNLGLSGRRAQAVRGVLSDVLAGEGPSLQSSGKGESAPVASNTKADGSDSPRGRERNRRVEIRIPKG